ncbi:sodium-translocating pyrophosphatase [Cutibacterium acnes]|uniref:sodium-translocating pyrophosphatase n=1 Tax=Cutibacterium acnes TaxID=1747 RepID=UPI0021B5415B|nr:sodium-translocating pyrophosphatase [Cutibacterium acnes]WGH44880.1 sodium-translocating pyrophosphatase [Cutibacterium acnes]
MKRLRSCALPILLTTLALAGCGSGGQTKGGGGGEANLKLPPLNEHVGNVSGTALLWIGLVICLFGLGFGLVTYAKLQKLPVHEAMHEVSELIYETCKTYLKQQAKFLMLLWAFIAAVIVVYFLLLEHMGAKVLIILLFSLVGMAGSFGVAWYGIRVNTFANSRTAHASLRGSPWETFDIPMRSGMSIGMVLISVELTLMLFIMLVLPGDLAGPCFIGFAIGESLGAACLRIAGGIFTKIADVGADLMKIAFHIKEDDARNPGVIADCTGDNAGDSVGPSADGFETYGVTGVALITFVLEAVPDQTEQVQLLVWIFVVRVVMLIASFVSYLINSAVAKARYGTVSEMDFEKPLSSLVWITSVMSILLTVLTTRWMLGSMGDGTMWWKLSIIISCGTLAGALIPELVKAFTSTNSRHVREVVTSAREGGASLDILSGLVAGNFSGFWLGIIIVALMGASFLVSGAGSGLGDMGAMSEVKWAVFAFGLVAFGFLGMGAVTIAVDSYGPVTDNAQSVYELSTIEDIPNVSNELKKHYGFAPRWDIAKHILEAQDGAGNTFKATAKPVLIGTAVVGATTMIFSIIMMLTEGLSNAAEVNKLGLAHAPFLLGLITGGAVIYWFSGASMQAVTTGAYRAVEFIKNNMQLDQNATKASSKDSKKVVQICTEYAQKGILNIFLGVFFAALGFAFVDPYFFIGYLISIAIFGLYQAIFMANAGGAWDNAKKIVEVDLDAKGTELHDASVVGDTVGDPFKDTSSVALNPVIKFTTLFGLLAVELAVSIGAGLLTYILAAVFILVACVFVYRSFYGMRIDSTKDPDEFGVVAKEAGSGS